MTPEQLSERFDISISAARIRLQEIERMKRRKHGAKRPLPASVLEYLREAKRKGHRVISELDD
jgi:hypothetical protein